MCKLLWVSLAIALAGVRAIMSDQSPDSFPGARTKDEADDRKRPVEVRNIGDVVQRGSAKGRISNVRLASDVPQIVEVVSDDVSRKLNVVVSLGDVLITGDVQLPPSPQSPGFNGTVEVTYSDMHANGTATTTAVVSGAPRVTRLDVEYLLQTVSAKVVFNCNGDKDLEEAATAFFQRGVKQIATRELDRRVTRTLDDALKNVGNQDVVGDDEITQRTEDLRHGNSTSLVVDRFLAKVATKITSSFGLNNINKSYKKNYWVLPIHRELHTTNGVLKNLKTLRKTSNVGMEALPSGYRLTSAMSFDLLQFSYDYSISVFRKLELETSGKLMGNISDSLITFAVKVTYDRRGGCTATIEDLRVKKLEGFSIKVTGLGLLGWLDSWVRSTVEAVLKVKIVPLIWSRVYEAMQSSAIEANFC